jgi:hypothetical protein
MYLNQLSLLSKYAGLVALVSLGSQANAQETTRLINPLDNISSIPEFFLAILDIVMIFAIPFVVIFIILAGFHYVTAQGNPDKLKQAHQALLYALIGGVLILGAQVLLTVIEGTVEQIINPS